MSLKKTGVELVAENNATFLADIGKANKVIDNLGTTAGKVAKGGVATLGKAMAGLGKVVGGLALGGAVAGIGALSAVLVTGIGDAREAAQVMAATENVIKSMGREGAISADEIAQMSAQLSAAEGMSLFGDDEIQSGQNMLLTFANINEVLPQATQAMVDMTQFMGGDMVGASTMLGKALDNPTQGLSALSRVGVSFTEQQKEQIKVMQEAGNMAGAQGIILDALKSQFGGAALAAAQADGGWTQFRDRMGEIGESVGGKLLPILNKIPQALNSPEVQAAIAGFADGLATVVGGAITWVLETGAPLLMTGLGTVVAWLRDTGIPAFTDLKNAIVFLATGELSGGLFGLSIDSPWMTALFTLREKGVEAFNLTRDAFITFRDALAGEWNADPEKIHPLHEAVGEFGLMIRDEALPALKDLYASLIIEAPAAWATFRHSIDTDVIPALEWMSKHLSKQKNEDLPAATTSWQQFGIDVAAVLNSTSQGMNQLGLLVRNEFIKQSDAAKTNWTSIGENVKGALTLMEGSVKTTFTLIKTTISTDVEAIKLLFTAGWGIAMTSIQDVFVSIGGYISGPILIAKGLVEGAISTITGAIQGAINLVNNLISVINSIPSVNIPSIPSIGGGSSGFGGKSISPPASASQLARSSSYNSNTTNNWNYSASYGATPNNPSQDFAIMQALVR